MTIIPLAGSFFIFFVERDEAYIIPMLKEILKLRPDLYLFASPWSPPGWMNPGRVLCGGYMRDEYVEACARYIVKYLKAYREQGISVSAPTPQNELEIHRQGRMPACLWHPETEAKFIRALRKKSDENGLKTKIGCTTTISLKPLLSCQIMVQYQPQLQREALAKTVQRRATMAIVSAQNLKIEFGDTLLFGDVNFDIYQGEHVGLIGANGTGKTTLFKLIVGDSTPTDGCVITSRGIKIAYLEQYACAGSQLSVLEEGMRIFLPLMETEAELERIAAQIDSCEGDLTSLIERQHKLTESFQNDGGLTFRSRTRSALIGLGFSERELELSCDKLSGGQRSKLAMCKLLLSGADLLLLDEPTNHLDISGTEWLEGYLQGFRGTVIVISHDRYFLDKTCNKTIEVANKTAYCASGNYTEYQKVKKERLIAERHLYENQLEEIKKLEEFVARSRQASATNHVLKSMGIERARQLEKKKAELIVPQQSVSEMRIEFEQVCVTGNDVLTVKGLSKAFTSKALFSDVKMDVYKSERVFILGPNGCGKTTLLKILMGQLAADSGTVNFGANVKLGYFDQTNENLTDSKTVLDEIWDGHRLLTETRVRSYLALFLFRGDDVFKKVHTLSGGEKAKLCLLKLMLSGANVLLLDEPTNHLDIPSREVLEKALSEYEGTVIAVSHDRYFINKLATKILRMTSEGLRNTEGGYDNYLAALNAESFCSKAAVKAEPKVNEYKLRKERESEINRLRGKIRRGESEIDRLEAEICELNEQLSSPETSSDFQKVLELTAEINTLTERQEELMKSWEELSEKLRELTE